MKTIALFLAALLSVAIHDAAAANVTIYQTSFEPPAFTPGLPIRGQDGWEMYSEGEAISVSTNNPHTSAQCLRFDGALLEQAGPNFVTAYCFSRALESLSNNPPAIVEITASVRLDGPQTGTNGTPDQDILSANLMAVVPQGNGFGELLGGFFVSSAGKIWTYSPVTADNYRYSVPYTFGTYRTLTLRVDFIARRLTWIVDGVTLGTRPFLSTITADRLVSGYLYMNGPLEPINTPEVTYDPANYTAYFDDYSLVSVPLSPVNAIIEFASTNILTDEFMATAKINVARRGFTGAAVRVTVSTTNGTAIAGEDYEAVSTFVTFAAGETNKFVEVPLKDDYFAEPDKAFTARITDLPPGATSGKPMTRVLIRDDERSGSIDYSWSSRYGLPPLGSNEVKYAVPLVYPFPVQPDGKLIVSFDVETPNSGVQYFRVVRLNTDGSLDATFPPIQSSAFLSAYLMPNGKVIITEDASPRSYRVFRRNADGTPDPTLTATITNKFIIGFKGLADGKMYTYGDSIGVNGQPPRNLVRLNSDGSLDMAFTAPATFPHVGVWPLAGGKVLVTKNQGPLNEVGVLLLNTNGTLDTNLNVGTGLLAGGNDMPGFTSVIVQPDGKFVLAGLFRSFNGQVRNSIVRLNPNGSIDPLFATGQGFTQRDLSTGSQGPGYITIHPLADGRILVSDYFDQFDGKPVKGPIVLDANGNHDLSFEATTKERNEYLSDDIIYVLGIVQGQPIYFRDYGLGRLRMNLPLRIVSNDRETNGTTRLTANALSGHNYTLQTSETLTNWTDLATQPATTNRIEFTDTPTNSPAQRFYRVKQD
ncbi:MAG TPA: Calx-beta domain-containing protein [Methylomirabilota bacterium]|nr:Calx-beta domain-containing protein [Methylomirabilota bacterium]